MQLGEYQKAIDDFNVVIEKAPQVANRLPVPGYRPRPAGSQGRGPGDLEQFQKGNSTESTKLYLAVIVAAELGEGADRAFEALEAALKKQPKDAGLHYDAACAYALASQASSKRDQAKSRDRAKRAISLLQAAVRTATPTTTTCRRTPT